MVGNLFFFIRSLLGVVFLCGESFRFFTEAGAGGAAPAVDGLCCVPDLFHGLLPRRLCRLHRQNLSGNLIRRKSSDPFCHAKRFTLRVVLFFTGCKVQTCCCYHDYAAADGEDRGSDSTGGREGGQLGICNGCASIHYMTIFSCNLDTLC